jgi:PEP-CTERM motif
MSQPRFWALGLLALLLASTPLFATTVTASIGTQHFANNSFQLDNVYAAAGGTGPFDNSQCGADDDLTGNCTASWSFTMNALNTVNSVSFTIGLSSLDSIMSGSQLGSFTIDGIDETAALNTAFEANPSILRPQTDSTHTGMYDGMFMDGGPGTPCYSATDGQNDFCSEYNVYTVNLTDPALLAALSGSGPETVNMNLALQGPGAGAFGFDGSGDLTCVFDPFNQIGIGPPAQSDNPCPTTYNGARLDFSKLSITGSNSTVPEPSTITLLVGGLAGLLARRVRKS